ncbi:MAG: transposase, partial [Verrucomicrobia bacterium]|nr:transposase [Verrucomicrobiota bacterium]
AARSFQRCLFEACGRFLWRLHAFMIMRNHFHLAVETPEPNLSLGMKWLQGTWAIRFNRFRGEVGQPFQGRYKAIHVERGGPLARVVDYIHLNPVRAGVVPIERLLTYRWSSLPLFLRRPRPAALEPEVLLGNSGGWADNVAGWRGYREHLAFVAGHEAKLGRRAFGRLSRGWAIGSSAFRVRLNDELLAQSSLEQRYELLGADREAHIAARAELWGERLQALAGAFGVELARLPAKKSAMEKLRLAAALKRITSVSNRWLAERLQMGAATSVSTLLHRFHESGGTRTRAFKAVLSRFSI